MGAIFTHHGHIRTRILLYTENHTRGLEPTAGVNSLFSLVGRDGMGFIAQAFAIYIQRELIWYVREIGFRFNPGR